MALYHTVKQALIADIQSGKFQIGRALPNETELSARFGVSIGTLRRAVEELVADRVLLRQQGRGTFVGQLDRDRYMYQFFKIEGRNGQREFPHVRLLAFERVRANAEESQALGLRGAATVFRIENLLSLQGRPVVHDQLALPCALFPQLTRAVFEDRPGTIYELYQRSFGVTVVDADERARAVSLSAGSAKWLEMAEGAPVLRVARVAHTFDRLAAEYRVSIVDTRAHEFVNTASGQP
jgi:GntR family transcriptional regulator